jgi:hypothetical protein
MSATLQPPAASIHQKLSAMRRLAARQATTGCSIGDRAGIREVRGHFGSTLRDVPPAVSAVRLPVGDGAVGPRVKRNGAMPFGDVENHLRLFRIELHA